MWKITSFISFLIIINVCLAAKKCYECSTATNPTPGTCDTLEDTSKLETCTATATSFINCVKFKYKLNGKEYLKRGCKPAEVTCDDVQQDVLYEKKEFVDCELCDTDFCKGNNALDLRSFVLIVGISLLITLFTN